MSDYIVCYVRILTSGYLQSNAEFYAAFIEGARTMKEYCSQVSCQQLLVSLVASNILFIVAFVEISFDKHLHITSLLTPIYWHPALLLTNTHQQEYNVLFSVNKCITSLARELLILCLMLTQQVHNIH